MVKLTDSHLIMPGMATAHSHAFQRALRVHTQRRTTRAGSFWSWRDMMYALALKLKPEHLYAIARFTYAEAAMSGVTAVGEFHYLHHAPNGIPYADRLTTSEAMIGAAKSVGVRIALLRTAYLRGGHNQPLAAAQLRFGDPHVEAVVGDIEELQKRHGDDPHVAIGVAAHSVRAVPLADVVALAQFARESELPFHMHVAEQRRELDECEFEYGATPVHMLADRGVLTSSFVAIHATHVNKTECEQLGQARSNVCLCRTTERDLGDGLPRVGALVEAGVSICIGADSHCSADAFEEMRAVELDERSRVEARHAAMEAPDLLQAATGNGYSAIGMDRVPLNDQVFLRRSDPALAGFNGRQPEDAIVFAGTPRAVDRVVVDGETIVENGLHRDYSAILDAFQRTLVELGL